MFICIWLLFCIAFYLIVNHWHKKWERKILEDERKFYEKTKPLIDEWIGLQKRKLK